MTDAKKVIEQMADRKDFLNMKESRADIKKVFCKSLDKYLYIKEMGAMDQEAMTSESIIFYEGKDGEQLWRHDTATLKLKYLVRVLCDKKGDRLFTDAEFTIFADKSADLVSEIHNLAQKANKGPLENLEKNSSTGQEGGSSSD